MRMRHDRDGTQHFLLKGAWIATVSQILEAIWADLSAFLATAVLVGLLASRRRNAQLQVEALARQPKRETRTVMVTLVPA